jgi:tetratricopeptide (TPR) repeat protein
MTIRFAAVYSNGIVRILACLLPLGLCAGLVLAAPQTREDRIKQASRLYDAREYAQVLETLRPVLQENPEDKQAVQLTGLSHYFMGRLSEAIPYLEQSVQWFPDNVNYQNILGLSYIQTSAVEKARILFGKIFGVEPNSARGFLINAQMFLRQGIWNHAEGEARRGLEVDARIPQGHLVLAEAAMGKSNFEQAVTQYQAEIAINPGLWLAHFRLGEALERLQKLDEAVAALQRSIWLNSNFTGPYLLLGKILKTKGVHNLAAQMLEQAIKLDPRNSNAHYMLGQAYQSLGRAEDAEREFKIAQELMKSR